MSAAERELRARAVELAEARTVVGAKHPCDPTEHRYAVEAVALGQRLSPTAHESDEDFVRRIVRAYLRVLLDE